MKVKAWGVMCGYSKDKLGFIYLTKREADSSIENNSEYIVRGSFHYKPKKKRRTRK